VPGDDRIVSVAAPGSNHSIAPSPPPTPRASLAIATGTTLAAIAIAQGYSLLLRSLTIDESYVGLLALQAALIGLILLAARLERRPLRDLGFTVRDPISTTVAFASLLVLLFVVVRVDPGFFFGFGKIPPTTTIGFGYLLFLAPVMAFAQVGFFVGYLFRTLSRTLPLRPSMFLSAGSYAVYSTDFLAFPLLSPDSAVEYVFSTTVLALVLGLVLTLYFYKARWSLVGPVALASALLATDSLLPVGAQFPSWEVDFAASLVAYAVLLIVVGLGLQEPRLQTLHYLGERIGARRHRFRNRARDRAALRGTLVTAAVVGVLAVSFGYGLPSVLGSPTPLLAIATGSMVPTLHRGDLVVVEHVAPSAITVGTIIAFSVSCLPSPTVHRVVAIVSKAPSWVYQTKGDANTAKDPCTVPYSDVHGAVIAHVPYVGYLILDPLFAGAVVVLAVLVPFVWKGEKK
jgi:signal peptidase I